MKHKTITLDFNVPENFNVSPKVLREMKDLLLSAVSQANQADPYLRGSVEEKMAGVLAGCN